MQRHATSRGFTLLEIIVALAVVTVGILAVARLLADQAGHASRVEESALAGIVAANRLAELRLVSEPIAIGTRRGSTLLGGRTWYFSERTSATAEPRLLRIDIDVYSDPDQLRRTGGLFGYRLDR